MEEIKEFFELHYFGENGVGPILFVVDIFAILFIIFIFLYHIRQKAKIGKIILYLLALVAIYFVSKIARLEMLHGFIKYISGWTFGLYILLFKNDFKTIFDSKKSHDRGDLIYKSKEDKEAIIKIICSTIEYLSSRKIGAIITFERKDSLDSIIQNAISLNADITQEILTTIFTPGTACHDGGVIIKNNKIVCAGAYYPLSDNYDLPTFLGTRHRAAIGMSERYDAITVVVSEETGNISITVSGNISLELSIDRVSSLLDGYLGAE